MNVTQLLKLCTLGKANTIFAILLGDSVFQDHTGKQCYA